jgi:hypothetical protein
MPDYSNTDKGKSDPKKSNKVVEKVVVSEVIIQKKPLGRKFRELFIEADFRGVFRYLGHDVLIPALRNMIVDAGTEGIRRMVYGQDAVRRSRFGPGSRTTYTNYSSSPLRGPIPARSYPIDPASRMAPAMAQVRPARLAQDDYVLATREEAEIVLEKMNDILDQYEVVTVGDLNELVGFSSTHIDQKYGWIYLGEIPIRQVRGGFLIDFPPAEPIP